MVIIIIGIRTTISFTPFKNIVQVSLSLLASVLPSLLSIALLLLPLVPSSLILILVLIVIIIVVVPMGLLPHQRHFNNRHGLRRPYSSLLSPTILTFRRILDLINEVSEMIHVEVQIVARRHFISERATLLGSDSVLGLEHHLDVGVKHSLLLDSDLRDAAPHHVQHVDTHIHDDALQTEVRFQGVSEQVLQDGVEHGVQELVIVAASSHEEHIVRKEADHLLVQISTHISFPKRLQGLVAAHRAGQQEAVDVLAQIHVGDHHGREDRPQERLSYS